MRLQAPISQRQDKQALNKERYVMLKRIENALEIPMVILGLIWLVLLIVELTSHLSSFLQVVSNLIWVVFILDFSLKFILAPRKVPFLKKNILTLISLVLPALRILRITRAFRLLRAVRSVRLVKVIGSLNRGMRSLGLTMQRRGFGYVLALTFVILFTGAAAMYAFEKDQPEGLHTYARALWWTAMVLITIGSQYWPQTPEGQIFCLLLALYGFTVFGYFTATLATFFIGRDAEDPQAEVAGASQLAALREEISLLRQEIRQLRREEAGSQPGPTIPPNKKD
ncbi:ion transporter [Rhodocytophaga aerolata]|uniref:Ion transporter n=1 Tax=Rhodocytophaga aerolata TaxID=455078 RepID=A0ABT8RI54_9BACT|nr:potassium channel family protein [Rhodocytophaga aerolata]MDO1451406.1 ion transporter [Rhodocytophaga aerolata]